MATLKKIDDTTANLIITIKPKELGELLDKAYKSLSKKIKAPGFRQGKIPASYIKSKYGAEIALEEALNNNIDNFYRSAVEKTKIHPLGQPKADIIKKPDFSKDIQGDLKLSFEVEIAPDIQIPDLSQIELEVDNISATTKDVDNYLNELQKQFGDFKSENKPIGDGLYATLNLKAKIDGKEVDKSENITYEYASKKLLDGLDEAIETLTKGETTTFEAVLPHGSNAGQTALIEVEIKDVKSKDLPEINDDFAKKAGNVNTLAEFKKKIKEDILKNKEYLQFKESEEKLVQHLIKTLEIPMPKQLLKDEIDYALKKNPNIDKKALEEDMKKSLAQELLLDALVSHFKCAAEYGDFMNFLNSQASQYGLSANQLADIYSKQQQIPSLFAQISRTKAIYKALGQINIKNKKGERVDISSFIEQDDKTKKSSAESTQKNSAPNKQAAGSDAKSNPKSASSSTPQKASKPKTAVTTKATAAKETKDSSSERKTANASSSTTKESK